MIWMESSLGEEISVQHTTVTAVITSEEMCIKGEDKWRRSRILPDNAKDSIGKDTKTVNSPIRAETRFPRNVAIYDTTSVVVVQCLQSVVAAVATIVEKMHGEFTAGWKQADKLKLEMNIWKSEINRKKKEVVGLCM